MEKQVGQGPKGFQVQELLSPWSLWYATLLTHGCVLVHQPAFQPSNYPGWFPWQPAPTLRLSRGFPKISSLT